MDTLTVGIILGLYALVTGFFSYLMGRLGGTIGVRGVRRELSGTVDDIAMIDGRIHDIHKRYAADKAVAARATTKEQDEAAQIIAAAEARATQPAQRAQFGVPRAV